jgi:hypothetical protein
LTIVLGPANVNLIEALIFVVLSGALLVLGRFLSGILGTVGWLIGAVPVGLFWAWVLFCNFRIVFRTVFASLHRQDSTAPSEKRYSG